MSKQAQRIFHQHRFRTAPALDSICARGCSERVRHCFSFGKIERGAYTERLLVSIKLFSLCENALFTVTSPSFLYHGE